MRYALVIHRDLVASLHAEPVAGAFQLDTDYEQVEPYTHVVVRLRSGLCQLERLTERDVEDRHAERWTEVRNERTALLSACDWTQLVDALLTTEQRTAWQAYRQALRDITKQRDPFAIVWPDTPKW
jgi:hypothetical protein